MLFPSLTATVSLLLLTSSTLAAGGHEQGASRRSSTHARHRRLANQGSAVKRAVPIPGGIESDIHGRQAPGSIAMRKRSDGSFCKVRSSSSALPSASASIAIQNSTSVYVAVAAPEATSATSSGVDNSVAESYTAVASTSVTVVSSGTGSSTLSASPTTSSVAVSTESSSVSSVAQPASSSVVPTTAVATSSIASSSSSSAAAAAATTTTASSSSNTTTSNLTPNNIKAGIAGGDSYEWMKDHIGWWYDWSPDPSKSGSPIGVPMLWGGGTADSTDATRLADFKLITTTPTYILGYEEPDCTAGSGSAGMDYTTAATLWNTLVAPWGVKGSILMSPSMCHQAAESGWLEPFQKLITRDFDVTNIHVNKNSMDGVKADIDHYYNTYGKPIWVSEFACVDDSSSFIPCTDQSEINTYISDIVDLFEADSRVYAYAYSDGYGLGDVWPTVKNGALSESGQAYLTAISKYH